MGKTYFSVPVIVETDLKTREGDSARYFLLKIIIFTSISHLRASPRHGGTGRFF
jgi:hypothetical protein